MNHKAINVSQDYTRFPAGRYVSDGRFSGERFRNDFLIPALKAAGKVEVQFDGTLGPGSSFLEEAFGGLLREGFNSGDLAERLVVSSSDESLVAEVRQYLGVLLH